MTDLSRRALLGSAGAIGVGATLAGAARPPALAEEDRMGPARAALRRLLPGHADQFALHHLPDGPERFRVTGSAGRVQVAATGPATALTGVHWYLKYVCGAHISWSGSQLRLPARLPAPRAPLAREATVPHRFAFNDTHDGYTAPYADWARWERLIDVLALHGCNEVLVTVGQEAVYHRLLQDFGYSDAEARAWLPAPSHQPWWLLQNMSAYGGPLDPALIARRAGLARRIADRLRELGMHPVLPGYFGTVPDGFAARNPGARTIPQGVWAGLRRPDWLDPRTDAFARAAASFYRHQGALFGDVRHFKMDLLHEGGSAGDVPVPEAARAVQAALRTARPGATWVVLGWQGNPRRDLLDALDRTGLLVVDGLSDLETVTDRERDWGGAPYAFGTIPNFGGRTTIGAKTHLWTERFPAWRDKPGSALAGTAYMPEAAERDPAALELFSELAWRREPVDRVRWFERYADLRYGGRDARAREAFAVLRDTAYRITSRDGRPHDSVFAARPSLDANSGAHYATHTPAFDSAAFDRAFAALLGVREPLRRSDAYRHDLTDLGRQVLANRSWQLIGQLKAAFTAKDLDTFRALSRLWLRLMRLSDDMTGSHHAFLLGPWLADARREGLERTARVLVTTWADRPTADAGRLANYANRDWSGLIADFHLPHWQAYLDELEDALARDRAPKAFDWYAIEEPWTYGTKPYPLRPLHDPYRTARRVHETLARAPFQGAVTVTSTPGALRPGTAAEVTAAFRNVNGLRATGPVGFTLTGFGDQPPLELPPVPAAGTGTVSWGVTVPARPLATPVEPLPYELRATYGPRGEAPVTTVHRGDLYTAAPLDRAWRTYTTNGAVFGQLQDRYAINGGGQDLWKGTAEFGTLYQEGVLADGTVLTVRVDAQDETGAWARAGIVVRNSLATPGAPGFLNLAVTPANGVVLSYDSTGDGTLDTYRRITGVRAPVLLRLSRAADGFTGACSADGGASWRTVATVRVPGAAAAPDAGLFMTAMNGGGGARGTVVFSGVTGWGRAAAR
ncbi:alpha-N-acetylglucosaminidase [Streptomyces sp. WAC05374]|uniref:alpha-N-acetylglucosaminidase n=2 Tax=Streptomyces sp. WAC05374 TaxID=2487420 RepID=UPI0010542297|nr:alpha-N-acetylglucosaminidase [Streptomyces sp. WAC05374]TDF47631.1 alpha-N-acetylglucosaminidase [Streptomyces sp. WAC05374]TDF48639.1 alpha-N-acetylglucosaminidase [Streptomyces sp. WAC05374]TDF59111.1 alpha-N-acetylglucosaminidase [Streptomyces sp. WAC05374]